MATASAGEGFFNGMRNTARLTGVLGSLNRDSRGEWHVILHLVPESRHGIRLRLRGGIHLDLATRFKEGDPVVCNACLVGDRVEGGARTVAVELLSLEHQSPWCVATNAAQVAGFVVALDFVPASRTRTRTRDLLCGVLAQVANPDLALPFYMAVPVPGDELAEIAIGTPLLLKQATLCAEARQGVCVLESVLMASPSLDDIAGGPPVWAMELHRRAGGPARLRSVA